MMKAANIDFYRIQEKYFYRIHQTNLHFQDTKPEPNPNQGTEITFSFGIGFENYQLNAHITQHDAACCDHSFALHCN